MKNTQKTNHHIGWRKYRRDTTEAAKVDVLQLTVLLLLQVHQEKLCWGNQVQRVTLGMLVLQVFPVSEGSLGSLDIQGVVISLDVMGQVEEVSPDYLSTEVMIL